MKLDGKLNILKRIPIRTEEKGGDTLYFDEDNNGELAMDELMTEELLVETNTADELWGLKEKGKLIRPEDFTETPTTESRERECEDCDDYQYNELDDFDDIARQHAPKELRDSVTWAINPTVEGNPDAMEFLVIGP